MHLKTRNVNTAFKQLVQVFAYRGDKPGGGGVDVVRRPYSNPNGEGYTLTIEEPVLVTYTHPKERVLFNAARDANPFFHLYEALWMLAGRNDVAPLAYYCSQIAKYSDDGKTFNGAYGYRWRNAEYNRPEVEYFDQLEWIIEHLRGEPNSRRAVLNMWTVEQDLLNIGIKREKFSKYQDTPGSRDVCCNLEVMFSLRDVEKEKVVSDWNEAWLKGDEAEVQRLEKIGKRRYLDITVTNRSNDLILGMLGTNVVHFSILQEYVAAHLGCEVGVYNQFSNNLHVYDWNWKPEEWLKDDWIDGCRSADSWYGYKDAKFVPLVKDPATFDKELPIICQWYGDSGVIKSWDEPFLEGVARPMFQAFYQYKQKNLGQALEFINQIQADDWRIACEGWFNRRKK